MIDILPKQQLVYLLAPVPGLPPTDISVDNGAKFSNDGYIGRQHCQFHHQLI